MPRDLTPSQAPRRFLFLQGLSTPLFWKLGRAIGECGAEVHRILICPGDRLFWPFSRAARFTGKFSQWATFLTDYLERHAITDIVLFSDGRPYHRVAIARARRRGITVHVFDEGYLRPDWITMERAGRDWLVPHKPHPQSMIEAASGLNNGLAHRYVAGGFAQRAAWDVAHHIVNLALGPVYPHYRRHRPDHPVIEAIGWIRKAPGRRPHRRQADASVTALIASQQPYFLFPLQLDSDYQIRSRSPFCNMGEVAETVFASFARHAPADAHLVVKVHPLDNGVIDRHAQMTAIAARHGLGRRILFLDGGHLPTLLDHCLGTVVVNSTVGMSSLQHKRPTITLGTAIYDLDGLTFGGPLDDFWTAGATPDHRLFVAFQTLLAHHTQINGSYFNFAGIELAIEGIIERLGLSVLAPSPQYAAPAYGQTVRQK